VCDAATLYTSTRRAHFVHYRAAGENLMNFPAAIYVVVFGARGIIDGGIIYCFVASTRVI
jgi:hypothetical protein